MVSVEGQHRGYVVFQRIERRHIVTAAIQPYDRSLKCDVHCLAFAFGRDFLRVVIADLLTAFDDGIQPHALRVGMLDETLESTLLGSRIGLEDPHVSVELPVVAILHAAEQLAPDTDLLKRHEAVRLVEHGCYGHVLTIALQLARQLDHEVNADLAHTLGDGARFGHHDHLVEFERHDALAVFEHSRRQEIDGLQAVAVLVFDILRCGFLFRLLLLCFGRIVRPCAQAPALKPARNGTTAQQQAHNEAMQ